MNTSNAFHRMRQKILHDLLDRFPDIKNLTAAKILYRDNPELFIDIENARSMVRRHRGCMGEHFRKNMNNKYFKNVQPT